MLCFYLKKYLNMPQTVFVVFFVCLFVYKVFGFKSALAVFLLFWCSLQAVLTPKEKY